MTKKEEQIEGNLELLDVNLIHKAMTALSWTWMKEGEAKVPTPEEITKKAIFCMNQAWYSENKIFSEGGFESEVIHGLIEIRFILARANPLSRLLG